MNCSYGPYKITTDLESIGNNMFKDSQESRRLVVFFDCSSVISPCLDAIVLHRENNCPECDTLWYECPSGMGRTYTLIATPCGVTITSFEDGLLASGLCDATQFGSKHFCFDAPDKSLVTFVFEGHTFTVQGNIGSCSPDLFECNECQSEEETFEAFASLPTPPPDVSAPNFEDTETASTDDTPPTQIIPGEGRPDWRDEWNVQTPPPIEHDPLIPGIGVDTLCEDEKRITDRPQGVELPVCDSNDNPSVATLPSGHIIVAYENRGENGLTKISLAILSSSVHADVRYHRSLSRGTLLNNLAETGGVGNFEVYDEIFINANANTRIGFLTGPLAGSISLITKVTRTVDKSRITNTFKFDVPSGNSFEFPDKNNVHDIQWFLLDDQGSEDLPPPNEDNVITTINLPGHLSPTGGIVPVANPSIAVARNNLMVQLEQVIYVTYQAYESNQWRVYLREIVLGAVAEAPPIYVAPYLFNGNSQQVQTMQIVTSFELGTSIWDEDFSSFTPEVRIGGVSIPDPNPNNENFWNEIDDFPGLNNPWPTWYMWNEGQNSSEEIRDTSIYFCDASTSLPADLQPCFPDPLTQITCIGIWGSRQVDNNCSVGPQSGDDADSIGRFTRTLASRGTTPLPDPNNRFLSDNDIATTLRFAIVSNEDPGSGDLMEVWFWWGRSVDPILAPHYEGWRLQILRGNGKIQATSGVSIENLESDVSTTLSRNCLDGGCGANDCFIFRLYDPFNRRVPSSGMGHVFDNLSSATSEADDMPLREVWKCVNNPWHMCPDCSDDYVTETEWNEWRVETYRRGRKRHFDIYLNNSISDDVLMAQFQEWDPVVWEDSGLLGASAYHLGRFHGFGFAKGDNQNQVIVDRIKNDKLVSPKINETRQQITLDAVGVDEGEIFYEDDMVYDGWLSASGAEWTRLASPGNIETGSSFHLYNFFEQQLLGVAFHPTAWDYVRMKFCAGALGDSYYNTDENPRPVPRGSLASFASPFGAPCLTVDDSVNGLWSYTVLTGSTIDLTPVNNVLELPQGGPQSNNISMVLSVARISSSHTGAWPHVWFVMRLAAKLSNWWSGYRVRITKFTAQTNLPATTTPNAGDRPAITVGESYWKLSLYKPSNSSSAGSYNHPVNDEVYIKIVSGSPGAGETNIDWTNVAPNSLGSATATWPYFRVDLTIENAVPPDSSFVRVKVYVGDDAGGDPAGDPVKFDEISYELLHTFDTSDVFEATQEKAYYGFALFSGSKTDPELDGEDYFANCFINYVKLEKLPEVSPPLGVCCRALGGCDEDVEAADCLEANGDAWGEGEPSCTFEGGFDCSFIIPTGAACSDTKAINCIEDVTEAAATQEGYSDWVSNVDCATRNCPPSTSIGSCCRPRGDCLANTTLEECSVFFGLGTPGVYWREGIECSEVACPPNINGACCHLQGCSIVNSAGCGFQEGGVYFGDDTDCGQGLCTGACCDGTTCSTVERQDCIDAGFTFLGIGISCTGPNPCISIDPIGACCFSDNECHDTTEAGCPGIYSTWYSGLLCYNEPCSNPTPVGACCNILTGECEDGVESLTCAESGREYQGNGSVCSLGNCPQPTGACCFFDSCIDDLTFQVCNNTQGTYLGNHSICIPNTCTSDDPYAFTDIVFKPEDLWRIETGDEQYITRVKYHMQEISSFSLLKLDDNDRTDTIDFMFVIDYSTSMVVEIELIQQAVLGLAEDFAGNGFDVRFGFVIFSRGSFGTPVPAVKKTCGTGFGRSFVFNGLQASTSCRSESSLEGSADDGFTRNALYLQRSFDCWGVSSGFGAAWAAINFAVNDSQFSWRTDSAKFMFFLSDAGDEQGCDSFLDGSYTNDKSTAKNSLINGPPGTNGGVQFIPAVMPFFIPTYEDVAIDSGWEGEIFNQGAVSFEPIFKFIANHINDLLRVDLATVIERAQPGTNPSHLKKSETIITYDGDLTNLWTFNKADLEFRDDHVPLPGTATKGLSNFPFSLATGKTYGIDPVHIQGIPDNWVSFRAEGPLNYQYPDGVGYRASTIMENPILISTESTRPKVFVNNRNQVIVAYENYSSGTPQIEIKGTGDFHQDSITGPKASRIQRLVTPNDFVYRHAITLPGEGMNQICDFIVDNSDITHIVWQSNRDGFWEIYYANSFDLFNPVRITKSDNRSGHPSISVDETGSIFIAYHDDRFGPFNVMLASKDEERIIPLLEQDAYMASLRNKYTHYTNILPVFIDNPSGTDPLSGQFWATKLASDPGNDSENMIYKVSNTTGIPSGGNNISVGHVAIAFSSKALFGVTSSGVLTKIGNINDDNVIVAISPSVVGTIDLTQEGFENQEILDMDIDQFDRIWIMVYEEEVGGDSRIRLLYISSIGASIVATGQNGATFTIGSVEDSQFGGITVTSDNKFYIIYHNNNISTSQVLLVSGYPDIVSGVAHFDFGRITDRIVMPPDPSIVTVTSDALNVLHAVSSGNDLYSINKADGVATFLVSLTTESGVEPALPVGTTSGIAYQNLDTAATGADQYFHIRIDFYDNIEYEGPPFLSVDSRDNLEAFINDEVLSDPYAVQGLTARGILVSLDIVGIVFFDATHFVPGFSRLSQPFSFEPNQTYFPRVFVIDETDNPRESGISQPNSFSCSKCSRFGNNNFNASSCAYSFVIQNNQNATRFYNFQIDFYADTGKQYLIRRFEATPGSDDLQYMEVDNSPAAELWTAAGLPVEAGDFPFIQIYPVLDPQAGFLCGVTYTVQVNDCSSSVEEECSDFSILSTNNWFVDLVGETLQTIATDLQIVEGAPALTSGFSMALIGDNLGIAWRSDDNNVMYAEFNGETWNAQTVFASGIATYVSLTSIQNQPAVHWAIQTGGTKSSAVAIFDGSSWNIVPGNINESTTGDLPNPRSLIELAGGPLITYMRTGSAGQAVFRTPDAPGVWDTNLDCSNDGSCLTDSAIVNNFPAVAYMALGKITYAEWSDTDGTFSSIQNVSLSEVYKGHLGIAEINGQPAVAYIKIEGSRGRLIYARFNGSDWKETVVTGIMDFNKHVSMTSINNNPAIVYSVKQSSTTSQVLYATFNGSIFTNEIVDENLNIIDPMVSIIEFKNAPAISVAANPFKVYFFRQRSDVSVRDILPVFFCECASKIFTNRLTHLNEVSRWESSAHGFADTRVTDSIEDSLRPVIQTRTSGAVIILWEDENATENCLNPPCIRAATFRNTNQDQLRGSGTQSWFDYDFGISGQDPSLALDLYDRVNTVYEKAKPPDPVTGFHGNKVSKNELPGNELYRKVCDFVSSLSTTSSSASECDISSLEANVITFDEFVSSEIVRKIKVKESFVAYYTYNVSGILTPIVSSCNLELEIHGTPEIVALRLKNENSAIFGPWCAWSPQIGDFVMEKKHKISSKSGVKEICIQAMTYSGITTEFCIPIVADYETVVFQSKFYKDTSDVEDFSLATNGSFPAELDENLIELPLSEGISIASLPILDGGILCSDSSDCRTNEICISGICTPKTSKILVEIIPSQTFDDETIRFDVVQQGSNDTLGLTAQKGINNDGKVVYRGDFAIEREDNIVNVDGLARINPVFPSSCEDQGVGPGAEIVGQFTRDRFNVMGDNLTVGSTENIDTLSGFRQEASGRIGVTLDIRSGDDPYFVFGDPNYSLQHGDGSRLGISIKSGTSTEAGTGPGSGSDSSPCVETPCPPINGNGQMFDFNRFVCGCVPDPNCVKIENCPNDSNGATQTWNVAQCECQPAAGGG